MRDSKQSFRLTAYAIAVVGLLSGAWVVVANDDADSDDGGDAASATSAARVTSTVPTAAIHVDNAPIQASVPAMVSTVRSDEGVPDCDNVGPEDMYCAQVAPEEVVLIDDHDGSDVGPPRQETERYPLGASFATFAAELGHHFPHMDAEPASEAHAEMYSTYGERMGTRLQLIGPRESLETATLSLFDRIDAPADVLAMQASLVERFVRAAVPGVDPREVVAFVDGERLPPKDDELSIRSKEWEYAGKRLTVTCSDNYGSVDLYAFDAKAIVSE